MTPIVTEWVDKAEGDFATATRELVALPSPNYNAAAFHAQQCAEKYIKARLLDIGTTFAKTHDLEALLNLVTNWEPNLETLRSKLRFLTDMAVEVRYPGFDADKDDAVEAVEIATEVRETLRKSLGCT
jgi:HEPN domain-containing protein